MIPNPVMPVSTHMYHQRAKNWKILPGGFFMGINGLWYKNGSFLKKCHIWPLPFTLLRMYIFGFAIEKETLKPFNAQIFQAGTANDISALAIAARVIARSG